MFRYNDTVVDSSITLHAKIHKRHVTLSFYRVEESIASKIITYYFIRRMINLSDVLRKHWIHAKVCTVLKPLIFWKVNAMDCLEDG